MRWKLFCRGLALLLAGVVGCKQVVYVTEDDLHKFQSLGLPGNLANDPAIEFAPVTPHSNKPADINHPDREVRFMSLAEAVAIALEQGTIGNQSTTIANLFGTINSPQTSIDQPVAFNGGAGGRVGTSDSIRVLRLDPAIIGAGIEGSLSKFDAVFTSSINWTNTDRPIATSTDVIQAGNSNLNAIVQQDATATMGIVKPLPTGGTAGITFSVPYETTNLPARVNPSYRPDLTFSLEQPLLQGFGTDINQLRAAHPGAQLLNNLSTFNTQPTAEGILITRVRFDQQRAEFERVVQIMVLNTELAYWNLYYGYWNLYAQEQGLRFAYEAWRLSKSKFDAGRGTIADVGQTRGQYESFRATRLQALNDTLELERQLRGMLGMQGDDGKRLVPSDQPTLAPFQPNWDTALDEALALRPEIILARQEVKVAQMNLLLQKNSLLPDLRAGLTYDINSIGNRLDGPDPTMNALGGLSSNHFNNYSAQLRLNVPLGYRIAHTNVRIAQLQLARAFETLKDQERKTTSFLTQQYRRVPETYELIRVQRAARESFADQLRVRLAEYDAGKTVLDQLLEAQRFWANALSAEYLAIRDYNNALVAFEYAKGTVLTRDNIVISEGALPGFAQKRAVEHLREKSAALELHERPNPEPLLPVGPVDLVGPAPLEDSAPALQTLYGTVPPLKEKDVLTLPLPTNNAAKMPAASTAPTTTPPAVSKPMPSAPAVSMEKPRVLTTEVRPSLGTTPKPTTSTDTPVPPSALSLPPSIAPVH